MMSQIKNQVKEIVLKKTDIFFANTLPGNV